MGITLIKQWRITAIVSWVIALSPTAQAEKPHSSVADLRYGAALYEYFQGNHFEALSELMVAKERGGIQGHKDNPEIIEGGINLAFGMDRQATEYFNRLLSEDKPLPVRNAAWYYLARLHYQRGEYELSQEKLDKLSGKIPKQLRDDVAALDIQLLTRRGEYEQAREKLDKFPKGRGKQDEFRFWRPFLYFNLATVYIKQEKFEDALGLFSQVGRERLSVNTDFQHEQLAMYDKAYTAAGFSYFQQGDYESARKQFSKVRQNSPLANDALLGYGWAAARLDDFEAAIAPWEILSQRPLADDAVQEALLAMPYAYLQAGDTAQALVMYQEAEQIYIEQLARIDEAGVEILNQSIADMLDLDNPNTNYNWLLPEKNSLVKPHIRYLLQLFSLNRFQNEVQTIRDIHRIQRGLEKWQISLAAYRDLLEYRRQTFRSPTQEADANQRQTTLNKLLAQQQKISKTLAEAKAQQNVFLLLDEDRQDLVDFLNRGERNLKILADAGEYVEDEALWLKRYRGMLRWSAANDFTERLWAAEADLQIINEALSNSVESIEKINGLLTEAPDISSAQERINDYEKRIQGLLANNSQIIAQVEEKLREQIYLTLGLQRQRIQFYLSEARLAVAQVYDNMYLEQQK